MKEEELLSLKEELDRIKSSKHGLLGLGILIVILGALASLIYMDAEAYEVATGTGTFTLIPYIIIIVSVAIGITCGIISELKYGRDYQDKLKELKKSEREVNK